jgi:uncharacterized damage-inducible protein DinB
MDQETGRRLVAAWRTNNRATTYLVEKLPRAVWAMRVPGSGPATVRSIAAHLHNSRCRWIKALGAGQGMRAPRLVDPRRVTQRELVRAMAASSDGLVALMELGLARGGQVPRATWQNFPTDLAHFLSYFAAHEGHHRGQLLLAARQLGHRIPREVAGGVWQWTRMSRENQAAPRRRRPGRRGDARE